MTEVQAKPPATEEPPDNMNPVQATEEQVQATEEVITEEPKKEAAIINDFNKDGAQLVENGTNIATRAGNIFKKFINGDFFPQKYVVEMVEAASSVAKFVTAELTDEKTIATTKALIISDLESRLAESNSKKSKIQRYDKFVDWFLKQIEANPQLISNPVVISPVVEQIFSKQKMQSGGHNNIWFTSRDMLHNRL